MADYIYVDNSNVFIESKRVSAVAKGIAMNVYDAMNNGILDYDYKMSFGRLHECVAEQDRSKMLGRFFLDHGRHPMIRSGPTLSEPDSSLFLKIETSEKGKEDRYGNCVCDGEGLIRGVIFGIGMRGFPIGGASPVHGRYN